MAGESTDIVLWYWLYKLYTDFVTVLLLCKDSVRE